MSSELVAGNSNEVVPDISDKARIPTPGVLDFPNKVELVIDVSTLEQLLAQVVAARSEAEVLRPFDNGIDQNGRGDGFAGQTKTILPSAVRAYRTCESSLP